MMARKMMTRKTTIRKTMIRKTTIKKMTAKKRMERTIILHPQMEKLIRKILHQKLQRPEMHPLLFLICS